MNNPTDDYDSPWKEALTRYFPEFLDFYFPLAYQAIDWTQPHTTPSLIKNLLKLFGMEKSVSDELTA